MHFFTCFIGGYMYEHVFNHLLCSIMHFYTWSKYNKPLECYNLIILTLETEWHVFHEPQFKQFSDSRVTEAVPDPALISTRPLHQRYWRTRRAGQLKCHALNYFCSLQLWESPRNDTYRGRWGERTVERLDRESRQGAVRAIVEVGKGMDVACGVKKV